MRVSGNEHADSLASTADITCGLQLGRVEVLRALRDFLNIDRLEHHSTDHLKKKARGVEKGMICVQLDKHWHSFAGRCLGVDICTWKT